VGLCDTTAETAPAAGTRLKVHYCHGKPWQVFRFAGGRLELPNYGLCVAGDKLAPCSQATVFREGWVP
jgi:hypothetical protein